MRFTLLSLLLISTSFFYGCSESSFHDSQQKLTRFFWSTMDGQQATVKVLNQFGEPVEGAHILIGLSKGSPFEGNYLSTDSTGAATVPATWASALPVTIDAVGYIRQTVLSQMPGDLTVKLNAAYLANPAEIKGIVTSLPVVNGDKMIDFALMMPAMTRADLLSFDLNSVISPYTDSFTVAGQQANVPSNISLPTQKENYIFNLTVSKPVYRMISPTYGPKRYFAARGQFPFKPVIDQMRAGKKFYELLNFFSIQGGGLRDITLTGPLTNLDVPGNEMTFKNVLKVQPGAVKSDEVLVVVAVSDVANSLIPTDLKRVTSPGSLELNSLAHRPVFIVNVIKKQTEFDSNAVGSDRISASVMPYLENAKNEPLPLIDNPTVTKDNGYLITLPPAPTQAGISPLAISAVISDLNEIQNGSDKVIYVSRRWEIIGLNWTGEIQLPNWPLADMTTKKRFEINFIGSSTQQNTTLDGLIDAATHVTHASTEL